MFRRRRSRAHRARNLPRRPQRQRRLALEPLEDRRMLAIITVDSAADNTTNDGLITLREAIIAANNDAIADATEGVQAGSGADEIRFAIPGAGPHTINIGSALDNITEQLLIDGFSEPGAAANGNPVGQGLNTTLQIVLNGGGGAFDGLRIVAGADNSIIRGLVIQNFGGDGIEINGANDNTIAGNFIGTNLAGTADVGNGDNGVNVVNGDDNTIGGTSTPSRNLISGNDDDGVRLAEGSTGNDVLGNLIGTNSSGTMELGNTLDGVEIDSSPTNNVGGTAAGSANLISGNGDDGVEIVGDASDSNVVSGNRIGTNVAGTAALDNAANGVNIVDGADANLIGGTSAAARNLISGNGGDGVQISGLGTTGNMAQGNFIGTDVNGTAAIGNQGSGVILDAAANSLIGGNTAGARNIISGNVQNGVHIIGEDADDNQIFGNFIGTDVSGTIDLGNVLDGVFLEDGDSNDIGGSNPGEGNLISGNNSDGVQIDGALVDDSTNNLIRGNFIGTNVTGTLDLGNAANGVFINGADDNDVGGAAAGARNVLSGNNLAGVRISGADAMFNVVQGNLIGVASDGLSPLGNSDDGVLIIDASRNLIGGAAAGEGNTIAFNSDGVSVAGDTAIRNQISRNSMFNNPDQGIDLGNDQRTANDTAAPADDDEGPNRFQNFPVIASATLNGNMLDISYSVPTDPTNASFSLIVEFFLADSDQEEGQIFIGSDTYVGGIENISLPAQPFFDGEFLVATATDTPVESTGNTSEFSDPILIKGPDRFEVNDAIESATILGSPPTVTERDLSIHSVTDQDFYKYTAHDTGKLIVRIFFPHDDGDLRIEVQDMSGDVIAMADNSSSTVNFEELIIPVVSQQMYFVRVLGVGGACNFYDLEIENFPAPVPSPPDLVAASDTGMMNDDDITADSSPTFRIQADLTDFASMGIPILDQAAIDSNNDGVVDAAAPPGAGVFVTLTNLDTGVEFVGFATRVNLANPRLWGFTFATDLPDGEYFVSAAVQIVDGADPRATGRSQLSDPLTIHIQTAAPFGGTFELFDYSDSGMFDDDNVTNKMQPAFGGFGPENAKVRVLAQKTDDAGMPIGNFLLVGDGVVSAAISNESPLGLWEVTVEPLIDGKYNFIALFESLAGAFSDPVGLSVTKVNDTDQVIPNASTITSTVVFLSSDFTSPGGVPMTFVPISDINVLINIQHDNVEDLDIFLVAPDGVTRVALSLDNGGTGDNYTNTVFDDSAGVSITEGLPPFTGRFRPQESFDILFNTNAIGTWTLEVTDDTDNGSQGQLLDWSLEIVTPLMVVIDTEAPNTPYLDLVAEDDTGRNNQDNITKENQPLVTMTSSDLGSFAPLLFEDNFKFRIYDRYENTAEFLLYDSALDAAADMLNVAGDMFTAETFLSKILPEQFFALNPVLPNGAVINVDGAGVLADGVHNLKLEVEDRAGNISHDFLLTIVVDTLTPPVSFGLPDATNNEDGLTASSDSGVTTEPDTFADRVTSDTTPTFWGRAEANTTVRLYLDVDADGIIDLGTDIFLGQTTAIPLDGNMAEVNGYWEITSALDLNQLVGFPKDGVRRLLATAEDVAGNPMPMLIDGTSFIEQGVAALQIFIDTQGPQIIDVNLGPDIDFDLFNPKGTQASPTPLVHSLFIDVQDLPFRLDQAGTLNDFLYRALVEGIAETVGNYDLVGDFVGHVVIQEVIVHFDPDPPLNGQPAFASIELVFAEPLPDDRYSLTVKDNLVDPAGNRLDGESGASDPFDDPIFPTGDGVPGGNFEFAARFTVDSRPEIGVWAAGIIHIDTNGNFFFDPENLDFTNRDLVYQLGFSSDYIFAGNFVFGANSVADGFDKLAAYGRVGNEWRFLIDFSNDGVPELQQAGPSINGIPVAGNFDGIAANGDEVGIFTGSAWFFDTDHDFVVDTGFEGTGYAGFPIAGDFDNDGDDDVATYISSTGGNFFSIDLNTGGGGDIAVDGIADHVFRVGLPGLGTFGVAGVRERPVAADMNGDGADDLGLWVPDGTAIVPGDQGEWFFLLSDFERFDGEGGGGIVVVETVLDRIIGGGGVDFIPFTITPFGEDLYARFGNSFALPIVGNFDPPVTSGGSNTQRAVSSSTPTTPTVSTPTPPASTPPAQTPTVAPVAAPVNFSSPAPATASTAVNAAAASSTASVTTSVSTPVATSSTKSVAATIKVTKLGKSAPKKIGAPKVANVAPAATHMAKTVTSIKVTKIKTSSTALPPIAESNANTTAKVTKSKKATTKAAPAKIETPKIVRSKIVAPKIVAPKATASKAAKNGPIAAKIAQPKVTVVTFSSSNVEVAPTRSTASLALPATTTPAPKAAIAVATPTLVRPLTKTAVAARDTAVAASPSAPAGAAFVDTPSTAIKRTSGIVLFEPAIADAAVTDLRLTLADVKAGSITAEWDIESPPRDSDTAAEHDLALENAWDSLALGI